MNTTVSFRHMDSSPALRDYAVKKLERVVDKYVQGRVDATVVLSVEKFRHIANLTVQIKNLTVKGDSSSEDMYSSLDLALDKIERQLRRHKDRIRSHKPAEGVQGKSFRMSVVRPPGAEEEVEGEEAELSASSEAAVSEALEAPAAEAASADTINVSTDHGTIEVERQRDYEAKTLSIEEAALQLDLLDDRQFYVFTNTTTSAINIIYRRADGTFGLIET